MEIAALIIAVLALMAATASLTLQLATILKLGPQAQKAAITVPEQLDEPSDFELGLDQEQPAAPLSKEERAAKVIIQAAELEKLDEAFANPDVPYTGIDDEFGIS